MISLTGNSITMFASATAASNAMRSFVTPAVATLCALASLACVFFLINGGVQYMTSAGKPDKLEYAKKIIKNALIGLVLVIGAATLTAILSHAYSSSAGSMTEHLPTLNPIKPAETSGGVTALIVDGVIGLLRNIVESIGQPFVQALNYFITSTPLMGENSSVFNLWLAIVGMTDVLFILVVTLLGFHVMSFATFGFDEIELKHLIPQLALIFLLINTSIFAIDGVISLSNAMIHAMQAGFGTSSIWQILADITKQSSALGLAGLLVMIAFLVLTVILLVYYVGRLITLYIGAVLSPLILLLWLIPAFKDFALTALKTYLTNIFVLFVHVVILLLASSIFTGMLNGDASAQPNALMALIVGLATVLALLKTQGVMKELSYASSGPRAARHLSGQFVRGVSSIRQSSRVVTKVAKSSYKTTANTMKSKTTIKSAPSGGSISSKPGGTVKTQTIKSQPTSNQKSVKASEPSRAEKGEKK